MDKLSILKVRIIDLIQGCEMQLVGRVDSDFYARNDRKRVEAELTKWKEFLRMVEVVEKG